MVAALVCREMHWTWDDYHSNPAWFIDILIEMLKAESREQNKRNKQ